MKHCFGYPKHVREKIKEHINKVISSIDPNRYDQESLYTTALLSRLEGEIYNEYDFYIKIIPTIINDRGKNSAESRSGADFSITAFISDGKKTVEKAILVQAKMNESDLKSKTLIEQINKMKQLTKSPKVMVINPIKDKRNPYICSGNKVLNGEPYKKEKFADYFTKRIITTFDGDTREDFITEIQNSDLPNLHLIVRGK